VQRKVTKKVATKATRGGFEGLLQVFFKIDDDTGPSVQVPSPFAPARAHARARLTRPARAAQDIVCNSLHSRLVDSVENRQASRRRKGGGGHREGKGWSSGEGGKEGRWGRKGKEEAQGGRGEGVKGEREVGMGDEGDGKWGELGGMLCCWGCLLLGRRLVPLGDPVG
jgi:hypothetical protein